MNKMPPASIIHAVWLMAVIVVLTTIVTLLSQPWLGVSFQHPDVNRSGLLVSRISPGSSVLANLSVGDHVVYITDGETKVALSALLLKKPLVVGSGESRKDYLAQHQAVSRVLEANSIQLVLDDGKVVDVEKVKNQSFRDIPLIFWSFLFTNTIGLLIGVVVWASKREAVESQLLLLAGILFFLQGVVSSALMSRELTFSFSLFQWLASAEMLVIGLFASAMISILMVYPIRLIGGKGLLLMFLMPSLFWVNQNLGIFELPPHIQLSQYLVFYIFLLMIVFVHWRATQNKPVERAVLIWFAIFLVIPTAVVLLTFVIPVMFNQPPVIGSIFPRFLVLLIFLGWALAIVKFRLFAVERWWHKSWLWLSLGILLVALDISLVTVLEIDTPYALMISILIISFVYLPIRQWMYARLVGAESESTDEFLPNFSSLMSQSASQSEFERHWRDSLQRKFSPAKIELLKDNAYESCLAEDGLSLYCSDLSSNNSYQLSGKRNGTALFNPGDVDAVKSLQSIAMLASDTSNARETATRNERRRILTALHDSLGADLITLLHSAPTPELKNHAQRALQTLRDTVKISLSDEPGSLRKYATDWRAEIQERAEAAEVELYWNNDGIQPDTELTADQAIKLTHILREAVSNALKHANPTTLNIDLKVTNNVLDLRIRNDGEIQPNENWKPGIGLHGIESKVRSLNGVFSIEQTNGLVGLSLQISL